jgi:hypothetical protein
MRVERQNNSDEKTVLRFDGQEITPPAESVGTLLEQRDISFTCTFDPEPDIASMLSEPRQTLTMRMPFDWRMFKHFWKFQRSEEQMLLHVNKEDDTEICTIPTVVKVVRPIPDYARLRGECRIRPVREFIVELDVV